MLPASRKAPFTRVLDFFKRNDVWSRVGLCLLTTTILWLVTFGWSPAFPYRVREAPTRNLHSRTAFEFADNEKTEEARNRARGKILCLYENDQRPLEDLRQALIDDLFEVKQKTFTELDPQVWAKFVGSEAMAQHRVEAEAIATEWAKRKKAIPSNNAEPANDSASKEVDGQDDSVKTRADKKAPESDVAIPSEQSQTGTKTAAAGSSEIGPQTAEANPEEPVEQMPITKVEAEFNRFIKTLEKDEKLETVRAAVANAFNEIDKQGLLEDLEHGFGDGSMQEIEVYPKGNIDNGRRVDVSKVRIAETSDGIHNNLLAEFGKEGETFPDTEMIADLIYTWMKPQLPTTLKYDEFASREASKKAAREVPTEMKLYEPGDPLKKLNYQGDDEAVIAAGLPLDNADIDLLRAEHLAYTENMTFTQKSLRTLFFYGLFACVFSLICGYMYYHEPSILYDIKHFAFLLGLMLITFTLSWVVSLNVEWRSEIVPIVFFAMTIAIAYNIELSIALSALLALAFTVVHGFGMGELVVLVTGSSTAALLCRSIRSRSRLVYIGLISAMVVFPTAIGVNYLLGQPLNSPMLIDALWFAGGAGLAGLFMTAMLPFLEYLFDIHTDISLLELSDPNHPLLKELVQRAPGTYNHSINVASISEAAADSIGANGLLCRVGAYFHDIGKLRKPEYFIENQGGGHNKHDDLVPTMSTLVIIAHVKDGAEIARTHHLPKRIIDLIEQHHGTTLVEYFYRRATKQNEESENGTQIDEADFRYPGPRPLTPEAAVMMLADAVESASRALREPTPARIESLVHGIAKKRLDDGQFAQCPVTIKQLNTIQESLIKSLNAMYHARVKYPDQQ